MTMPNQPAPEGSQQVGSQWGQQDRGLTVEQAKARIRGEVGGTFGGLGSLFADVINGVVGFVGGVVGSVVGVFESIGSLFFGVRNDVVNVDTARMAAENAIVANMSSSLEMLDEIQRFGGAYNGSYEFYRSDWGEQVAETVPLTHALALQAGTSFIAPNTPWSDYTSGVARANTEDNRRLMARHSGSLQLNEPGLWLIYFRAGVLQGSQFTTRPADLWCYVTSATGLGANLLPVGSPGYTDDGQPLVNGFGISSVQCRDRDTGVKIQLPVGEILAYGRASSYVGTENAPTGGGVTLFGMVPAYLPDAGYKVSMAIQSYAKFGGPSNTSVVAYKVNSETLRDDIDALKSGIAADLPGEAVDKVLDEATIQDMINQSQGVPSEYTFGE